MTQTCLNGYGDLGGVPTGEVLVLIALFLLLPTGLYMFVLPYVSKRRGTQ